MYKDSCCRSPYHLNSFDFWNTWTPARTALFALKGSFELWNTWTVLAKMAQSNRILLIRVFRVYASIAPFQVEKQKPKRRCTAGLAEIFTLKECATQICMSMCVIKNPTCQKNIAMWTTTGRNGKKEMQYKACSWTEWSD